MSNPISSFFHSLVSKIEVMFKKAPSLEVQVSSALNYCAPFVEELDTLADPALAEIVNPIIEKVKTGLAALAVTINQAKTASGTANVQSIVASLQSNLQSLISAAQVKSSATNDKFTSIANLVLGEISAIASSLSSSSSSTAGAAA